MVSGRERSPQWLMKSWFCGTTVMLSNLYLLSFLLTVSITVPICIASREWLQFTAPEGISFSHLIPPLSSTSKVLYVAATGRLFLLNTSLKAVANETVCKGGGSVNGHCDNHNQLLSLDASSTKLVSCWSVDDGICHVRYASDLSRLQRSDLNQLCEYQSVADDASVVLPYWGPNKENLLLVGKTKMDTDSGPLSTKILCNDKVCRLERARVRMPEGNFGFNHQFVLAFHSSKHLYVLFSRNVQNNGKHRRGSFLGRLCLSDVEIYYSYVEVPLSCGSMDVVRVGAVSAAGRSLDDHSDSNQEVIFVAFGRDDDKDGDTSLCAFTLDDINRKIKETYKACYTGGDGATAAYGSQIQCNDNIGERSVTDWPCGSSHLPQQITGLKAFTAKPLLTLHGTTVTAFIVAQEHGENVAFLGSRAGHLLKVALSPKHDYPVYENITLPGVPGHVNKDSGIDPSGEHLYILKDLQVVKIPVENCGHYKTCLFCIRSLDPYCGWCVLQQRCTRKRECSDKANHWLRSLEHTNCPSVYSLKPASLSYQNIVNPQPVVVNLTSLPELSDGDELTCRIGKLEVNASRTTMTSVTCTDSLSSKDLPKLPSGSDHVDLNVTVLLRGVAIGTAPLSYYNCTASVVSSDINPCRHCVGRQWSCNWCVKSHHCTHLGTCSADDQYVQHGQPSLCPTISGIHESSTSYYIPVGIPWDIQFAVNNLHNPPATVQCDVMIEGNTTHLKGNRNGSENGKTFYHCEESQFSFSSKSLYYKASLNVQWESGKRLDNAGYNVTFYDCKRTHSDCSQCQASDDVLRCEWCKSSADCMYETQCNGDTAASGDCPPPNIISFEPKRGPTDGGTKVTICGTDLGQKANDIQDPVVIAGVRCNVTISSYRISQRVVCVTEEAVRPISGPLELDVRLPVSKQQVRASTTDNFTFEVPVFSNASPERGFESGETRLTLYGEKLDLGHEGQLEVFVGPVTCRMETVLPSKVECITGPYSPGEQCIVLQFRKKVQYCNLTFTYIKNPVISKISPQDTYYGGGRVVTVTGERIDAAQQVQLFIETTTQYRRRRHFTAFHSNIKDEVNKSSTKCTVVNKSQALCHTPHVPANHKFSRAWLEFDGHTVALNGTDTKLNYYSDPQLCLAGSQEEPYQVMGKIVHVQGRNMKKAITLGEVKVSIGDEECSVSTLDDNALYCKPPPSEPQPANYDFSIPSADEDHKLNCTLVQPLSPHPEIGKEVVKRPELMVQMGGLWYYLGPVQYTEPPTKLPPGALAGVITAIVLSLLLILAVMLLLRYKGRRAKRRYEQILMVMGQLEDDVREQCRREFADFMQVPELSNQLDVTGMPLLPYGRYLERMLFPLAQRKLLLNYRAPPTSASDMKFQRLLDNEAFMVKFLQTLDKSQLQQSDRGHIASLTTVALLDRPAFLWRVLLCLITDFISNNVERKPKLLFRRTETVVEKMLTNWMSVCLFNSLRDSVGKNVFMLFLALRTQIGLGPVDCVLQRAHFTLAESSLLCTHVDNRHLTIKVIKQEEGGPGGPAGQQLLDIMVLDCDSIGQVKHKILDQLYPGTPFSELPDPESLTLELRSLGGATGLALSDIDQTSEVNQSYIRCNTLKHYNIWDKTTMMLVPQSSQFTPGAPPLPGPNRRSLLGERIPLMSPDSLQPWHLIKEAEEEEERRRVGGCEKHHGTAIPEIYLTRLLSFKMGIQELMQDAFKAIHSLDGPAPPGIKMFFDFLDQQASNYGVSTDIVHIWKSNSLALRFWVQLLKDPSLAFDVEIRPELQSTLDIISQTFMDFCSNYDQKITKDTPTHRLLFARELPRCRHLVDNYYEHVANQLAPTEQEFNNWLEQQSYTGELRQVAMSELYKYGQRYYTQIVRSLEDEGNEGLVERFQEVYYKV
uniref:plexin-B3-like isoform X1 n=2 Tax=Myxine glutinosa TaxID=7769 RepID=UPI00358E1BA8